MDRLLCLLLTSALLAAGPTAGRGEGKTPGRTPRRALSPKLAWIGEQGFRLGYNYGASLDWYPRAKTCGLNGIISRLDIANDPSGDEALEHKFPPGAPAPGAVQCWRLLRPSSRLAKENGLHFFFMLNLGGSWGNISDGFRDNPRRFNNGKLFSPLDEVYWTRVVENRFLRVADTLAGDPYQLDGFLIDPEMYSLEGAIPGDVDYGDYALNEFVKATGTIVRFAGLSIPERRDTVRRLGLTEALYRFEFDRVRALAQRTRRRLQAKRPDAILGFFLWRDVLWFKAVAAGFGTPRVPCFVGPETTYPGSFGAGFLRYRDQVRRQAGAPIFFVPGLRYGFEHGAVPVESLNVLPGNLYHRSIHTDGYWFWALSRLGKTDVERKPFLDALRMVNEELDKYHAARGAYISRLRAAALPVQRPPNLHRLLVEARRWRPVPTTALPTRAPKPTGMVLRGLYAVVMPVQRGEDLSLRLRTVRLGKYLATTACTFYRPDGSALPQPETPFNRSRTVAVEASVQGVWVAGVTAHNNAFWVLPGVRRGVIAAHGPVGLCKTPGTRIPNRVFFYVPRHATRFRIAFSASEREPATFRVFDPTGRKVFEQVALRKRFVQSFAPGGRAGAVWWLESSDAVEDHSFQLLDIPNLVAASPEQLMAPEL